MIVTITIQGNPYVDFTVRLVKKGMGYGINFALVHGKDDPLVELYDQRYQHTVHGQFVGRYYLSTLRARPANTGLLLDGGNPEFWCIDAAGMEAVNTWLNEVAP